MSERIGQLEVRGAGGVVIGYATVILAPSASVHNGVLDLPGISDGIDGTPANPTAQVGLTAVNGSLTTFMRSDAAPALDQSIAPTWAGQHTFSLSPVLSPLTASRVMLTDGSKKPASSTVTQTALETAFGNQAANQVWAGPASGAAAAPAFRALAVADIPTLTSAKVSDFATAADARIALQKGAANGLATLGSDSKIPIAQLPDTVVGAVDYQGTWNAATNTPNLGASSPSKGDYYKVSVAGSTSLGGITDWKVGDWAIYNGTAWEKLDQSETVSSVNGQVGAVVLTKSDVGLGNVDNTSDATKNAAAVTLTNKTFALGSNSLSGTTAQFNAALTDGDFATLAGTETLSGKTLTSPKFASGDHIADANGNELIKFPATVASAVNEFTVSNAAAGGGPNLSATGGDANIDINLTPKGSGAVKVAGSVQATGLTLTGNLSAAGVASSLIPSVTDAYDLGSSTKLWRKGWLSELDAVLFAKNTVTLVGGWLRATKNEGAIPVGQDVGASDTTIDFGQAMTVGDFVEFRAAGSVEYVQVGSLVSGTRYNVNRNLDLSGANAWPAGSVYAVNGGDGSGRIDINANSTPRISLIRQGATYNAQTELVRVGDLNGWGAYASETYGFVAGEYAAGKAWVSVDPANGFRVGSHADVRIKLAPDGSGFLANSSISWDAAGFFTVAGNASIAGWAVQSAYLAKDTGTNATSAGLAPNDYPFFAGATYANRATAPYRVTPAGALTATNANITGAVTATSGAFTGTVQISSASGALAVGATPPTSASAGTGIWLDRTGFYGLASDVVQAKFDAATGRITAAGGSVALDASGLWLVAGTGFTTQSAVTWYSGADRTGAAYNYYSNFAGDASAEANTTIEARSKAANSGGQALLALSALNNLGRQLRLEMVNFGAASGSSNAYVNLWAGPNVNFQGVLIGSNVTGTPNAMLDVRGAAVITGNLAVDTNVLFVDAATNRVGFGTTTPKNAADINGNCGIRAGAAYTINKYFDPVGLVDRAIAAGYAFDFFQDNSTGRASFRNIAASVAADATVTMVERFTIRANGNVGIGVTSPNYLLELATDSAGKPGTSTWTVTSDVRTKDPKSIVEFGEGLETLLRLPRLVEAQYNGRGATPKGAKVRGFIAQELAAAYPGMVRAARGRLDPDDDGETDILSVNYHDLPLITVNAVRQLWGELQAVKAELAELKKAPSLSSQPTQR